MTCEPKKAIPTIPPTAPKERPAHYSKKYDFGLGDKTTFEPPYIKSEMNRIGERAELSLLKIVATMDITTIAAQPVDGEDLYRMMRLTMVTNDAETEQPGQIFTGVRGSAFRFLDHFEQRGTADDSPLDIPAATANAIRTVTWWIPFDSRRLSRSRDPNVQLRDLLDGEIQVVWASAFPNAAGAVLNSGTVQAWIYCTPGNEDVSPPVQVIKEWNLLAGETETTIDCGGIVAREVYVVAPLSAGWFDFSVAGWETIHSDALGYKNYPVSHLRDKWKRGEQIPVHSEDPVTLGKVLPIYIAEPNVPPKHMPELNSLDLEVPTGWPANARLVVRGYVQRPNERFERDLGLLGAPEDRVERVKKNYTHIKGLGARSSKTLATRFGTKIKSYPVTLDGIAGKLTRRKSSGKRDHRPSPAAQSVLSRVTSALRSF